VAQRRSWLPITVGAVMVVLVAVSAYALYVVNTSAADGRYPPVVMIGTLAAPAPLTLASYPPGDLAVDGGAWPRACDLFSDDELRQLFPRATEITRTGAAETVSSDFRPNPPKAAWKDRYVSFIVPERSCEIRFDLPHRRTADPDPPQVGTLTVAVTTYGDPEVVAWFDSRLYRPNAPAKDKALARDHGAIGCDLTAGDLLGRCTKGPLTLSVAASIDAGSAPYRLRMPDGVGIDTPMWVGLTVLPAVLGHLLDKIPA
jgi:hypothetical protein